jgi:hypothetical protein
MKINYIDKRDTIKLFTLGRYVFTSGMLIPALILCNHYMEFNGTMFAIISAILVFQELIVFIMLLYKIKKARVPVKIKFLDRRYGPEIDR